MKHITINRYPFKDNLPQNKLEIMSEGNAKLTNIISIENRYLYIVRWAIEDKLYGRNRI